MKVFSVFGVVLALHVLGTTSVIIPDELPSILSVIYSNIPTIKKGTDSRIGWGFRLGDRADVQVLVELGPQTNTQQLANQGDGGSNKRNALDNLSNTLYAQRQRDKKIKDEENKRIREEENKTTGEEEQEQEPKPSVNDGGQWLKTWSKSVNKKKQNGGLPLRPKPGLGIGEIDAKSVIPDDSVLLAQELKKKLEKMQIKVSTEETTSAANAE
ncbi:hypothetical protein NQ315_010934 [Exocentrus adspersus]|uniref:Secreted protein n=1 Tax=Exocentrus adspersus TaxID=1586481 RepID=A0AAV8VNS7_9CUCU|nr:hypothetical protein NQ315_010934 [Exocentrus adspersus]